MSAKLKVNNDHVVFVIIIHKECLKFCMKCGIKIVCENTKMEKIW